MSDTSDTMQPLSGRALHFVLQRPDVRAAYENLMTLKAAGPRSTSGYFEQAESAAAEWFRLSREAAKALTSEQRG